MRINYVDRHGLAVLAWGNAIVFENLLEFVLTGTASFGQEAWLGRPFFETAVVEEF